MHHAAKRPERARQTYEFAGYIACIHCGLTLGCQGHAVTGHLHYRDTAKSRRIPCPAEGDLTIRADLARDHSGELLKSLTLPDNWRGEIRRQMLAEAQVAGTTPETIEREKERLKLKKTRILKQHREDYIDDDEFQGEMAAVALALRALDIPVVGGVKYDEVIEAGEHIPGMVALWDVATPEERREMALLLLEPGGLYYDMEQKIIAAIKPRPAFLPILRMLSGVVEYDEAKGLLVAERWQDRNRRASNHRSVLALIPLDVLFAGRDDILVYKHSPSQPLYQPEPRILSQRRVGSDNPQWKILPLEWPTVLHRIEQGETLRKVASDYNVSYEAVRRVIGAARKQQQTEAVILVRTL